MANTVAVVDGQAHPADRQCELDGIRAALCEGQRELIAFAETIEVCIKRCGRRAAILRFSSIAFALMVAVLGTLDQHLVSGQDAKAFGVMLGIATALAGAVGTIQATYGYDRRVGGAKTLKMMAYNKVRLVKDEWDALLSQPINGQIRAARALRHAQALCISQILEQANQQEVHIEYSVRAGNLDYGCMAND